MGPGQLARSGGLVDVGVLDAVRLDADLPQEVEAARGGRGQD